MNILIDCVRMVTELTVAVPTEQQIAEYAFLAVFRLWCAAFGFGYERLYLFEITPCNNRLVNILVLFLKDLEHVLKLIISPQYSC